MIIQHFRIILKIIVSEYFINLIIFEEYALTTAIYKAKIHRLRII